MKRALVALALGASMMVSPLAFSADKTTGTTSAMKIGVLDVRQVIDNSPDAKRIEDTLKKEFQPKIDEMQSMEKTLRTDMEKLQRDKDVMSTAEKTKLETKIQENQRVFMAKQNQYSQESTTKQQKLMQEFLDKVKMKVEMFAKKEKYDLILISDAVPYVDQKSDVTAQIMKSLSDKA